MSLSLQRLLLDHIRRGGWYWLLVGFMQVSATFNYALPRPTTVIAYPMMGAIFAPMILNLAEQRGWFRILMILPLARRDIARTRWWVAIGAPGIFDAQGDIGLQLPVKPLPQLSGRAHFPFASAKRRGVDTDRHANGRLFDFDRRQSLGLFARGHRLSN